MITALKEIINAPSWCIHNHGEPIARKKKNHGIFALSIDLLENTAGSKLLGLIFRTQVPLIVMSPLMCEASYKILSTNLCSSSNKVKHLWMGSILAVSKFHNIAVPVCWLTPHDVSNIQKSNCHKLIWLVLFSCISMVLS